MAVPGFALPNRFRGVRDLCFSVVEGPLCARSPIYFLIQRQRSPTAHLVRRTVQGLVRIDYHGCSCPGPVLNRDRVVDALSIDGVEGPFHVRLPIILIRTSGLRLRRALAPIASNALLGLFILFSAVPSLIQKGRGWSWHRRIANHRINRIYRFDYHRCPNVRVEAEARFGADSLQRLVGAVHFVFRLFHLSS